MAAFDYFLKLDGIPGESVDAKHKGEIDVLSWSWGESQPAPPVSGGGAGAGKVSMTDLHVSANLSKASPQLLLACASGTHLKSAVLTGRKAGKAQAEFLTFSLSDVLVSGYQTGGADGGGTARLDLAELLEDRDDLSRVVGQGRPRAPDPGRLGPQGQQVVLSASPPGAASPYDTVPYPGHPYVQSHPDRLATLARLFGLSPAPPSAAACSSSAAPAGATSSRWRPRCPARASSASTRRRAIARGRSSARSGWQRELQPGHRGVRAGLGSFDYVISHGVYSWVPAAVRERLLAICGRARRAAWPTSATTRCPAGTCARRCAKCSSSTPSGSPTRASACAGPGLLASWSRARPRGTRSAR